MKVGGTTATERMPRMRHLDLREFEQSEPIRLSLGARRALRGCLPSLTIAPAPDSEHAYVLTPGATIGAVEIEDLSVSIQPKLGIGRVLFLASYTMGAFRLRDRDRFDFRDEDTLVEALVPGFASAAKRAFAQGLLHGYRTEEETLQRRPRANPYGRTDSAKVRRSSPD